MLDRIAATAALVALALAAPADAAEKIRLSTGGVITVEVLEINQDIVRFQHAVLGELTVPRSSVTMVDRIAKQAGTPSGADAVQPKADRAGQTTGQQNIETKSAAKAAPAPEPEPEPEPEVEWTSKLVVGGAYTTGNTENKSFNLQFTSDRKTNALHTSFDMRYFYAESSGDQDTNRFTTGLGNDWLVPDSKWFYFARTRYTFDEEQSWTHRASVHGGPGYHLFEQDDFTLDLRTGAGFTKEWDLNADRPELLFGVEIDWSITDKQELSADSTIYPDLNDTGQFRVVNNVGWSIMLDEELNFSLNAGLQHEYQSDVSGDDKKNDLRITAGLGIEF